MSVTTLRIRRASVNCSAIVVSTSTDPLGAGDRRVASRYQRPPNSSSSSKALTDPGGVPADSSPADRSSCSPAEGRPSGLLAVWSEDAGEEQREVAEAAEHAGPFGGRHGVEQPGQLHRVELAEAPPTPAPTGGNPGAPTDHVGV